MIDVIIPVYNNADTLDAALESVLRQSMWRHISVYIADDASTDNSREIIDKWRSRYSNITAIFNQENKGVIGNYINIVSRLQASYVAPLEADDYWTSTLRLETLCDLLSRNEMSACFNGFIVDDVESGNKSVCAAAIPNRFRRYSAFDLIQDNAPGSFTNCFYKRGALLDALRLAANATGYDWLVNTIIADRCGGLEFYPNVLSSYRVASTGAWSSLSAERKRAMLIETLASMRRLLPERYFALIDRRRQELRGG
jgi:glycosyltransferase involved in cell wall biosynthesis